MFTAFPKAKVGHFATDFPARSQPSLSHHAFLSFVSPSRWSETQKAMHSIDGNVTFPGPDSEARRSRERDSLIGSDRDQDRDGDNIELASVQSGPYNVSAIATCKVQFCEGSV